MNGREKSLAQKHSEKAFWSLCQVLKGGHRLQVLKANSEWEEEKVTRQMDWWRQKSRIYLVAWGRLQQGATAGLQIGKSHGRWASIGGKS
jgi:hypothetical protein